MTDDDAAAEPQPSRSVLTPREAQCILLAAEGRSTAQTAAELNVTERTVEFHLQNAARRLGANTKLRAVVIVMQQGLS